MPDKVENAAGLLDENRIPRPSERKEIRVSTYWNPDEELVSGIEGNIEKYDYMIAFKCKSSKDKTIDEVRFLWLGHFFKKMNSRHEAEVFVRLDLSVLFFRKVWFSIFLIYRSLDHIL